MAANGPSAHLAVAVSIGSTLSQQRHLSSVLPFALGIETNLLPQCEHRVTGSIAFLPFRFQRGNVPFVPIPGTCADCRRFPHSRCRPRTLIGEMGGMLQTAARSTCMRTTRSDTGRMPSE